MCIIIYKWNIREKKYEKSVKIISACVGLAVVLSGLSFSYPISAKKNYDDLNVYYLTKHQGYDNGEKTIKTRVNKNDAEVKVKNLDKKALKELNDQSIRTIWVDEEFLEDSDIALKVRQLCDNGNKIVIRGEGISKAKGLNLLGITGYNKEVKIDPKLKTLAVLIEKVGASYGVTGLNVENYSDDKKVEEAMLYITKNNFNKKLHELKDKNNQGSSSTGGNKLASFISKNIVHADWAGVDVDSDVDSWTAVNVSWSQDVRKDTSNPTSTGKYRSSHLSIIQTEVTNWLLYEIKSITIYQDAGGSSTVNNYAPLNGSTSGNISVSFPWGISYAVPAGANISWSKTGGGVGTSSVQVKFKDNSPLNDYEAMNAAVSSEHFQTSSYFSSGVKYSVDVDTNVDIPYGTASASHYVGGN